MISFYILSETWKIIWSHSSINNLKRIWFSSTFFVKIYKGFKVNIWWMVKCNLLKFAFVWNFHKKIARRIQSNIIWHRKTRLCNKNKKNIFVFLPLINNSVTIEESFLLLTLPAISKLIFYVFYLGCILQCFYIYYPNHFSIQ